MTRKDFLVVAGSLAVASLLPGCTPPGPTLRVASNAHRVRVPVSSLPDLSVPFSFVRIYVDATANPYVLFPRDDGALIAVLTTCSHSGCEVRKTRTKFECPCHGSEYDLDGNVTSGPAPEPLETRAVVVRDGFVEFSVE